MDVHTSSLETGKSHPIPIGVRPKCDSVPSDDLPLPEREFSFGTSIVPPLNHNHSDSINTLDTWSTHDDCPSTGYNVLGKKSHVNIIRFSIKEFYRLFFEVDDLSKLPWSKYTHVIFNCLDFEDFDATVTYHTYSTKDVTIKAEYLHKILKESLKTSPFTQLILGFVSEKRALSFFAHPESSVYKLFKMDCDGFEYDMSETEQLISDDLQDYLAACENSGHELFMLLAEYMLQYLPKSSWLPDLHQKYDFFHIAINALPTYREPFKWWDPSISYVLNELIKKGFVLHHLIINLTTDAWIKKEGENHSVMDRKELTIALASGNIVAHKYTPNQDKTEPSTVYGIQKNPRAVVLFETRDSMSKKIKLAESLGGYILNSFTSYVSQ